MKKAIVIIGILIVYFISSKASGQVITVKVAGVKVLLFDKDNDYISFHYDKSNVIMGEIDQDKQMTYLFDITNENGFFLKPEKNTDLLNSIQLKKRRGIYLNVWR